MGLNQLAEKGKLLLAVVDSPFAPVVQTGLSAGSSLQSRFEDLKRIVQTLQLTHHHRQDQKLNPEVRPHLYQSLVE
jgi:hypothetical protein